MAFQYNGISPTAIKYNGVDLTTIKYNGSTVWFKPFDLILNVGEYAPVTISRISSLNDEAIIGTLTSNDKIYYGDKINISLNVEAGGYIYVYEEFKINGENIDTPLKEITVTSNIDISTKGFRAFSLVEYEINENKIVKFTRGTNVSAIRTIPSSYLSIQDFSGNTVNFSKVSQGESTQTPVEKQITAIGTRAFYGESYVTDITIPSTVTHIESFAFADSDIKELTIEGTSVGIDGYAFAGSKKLTSFSIFGTPSYIGEYAFAGTQIKLSSTLYNCPSLAKGCFATNTAWRLTVGSSLTAAQAEKIRATTTGATGTYNGVNGYGGIYITFTKARWIHAGGDNGTSTSNGNINCTFDAGIQYWEYTLSTINVNNYYYSPVYVCNSSLNPMSPWGQWAGSWSNLSSTSATSPVGYETYNGMYCYRLDTTLNVTTTCVPEYTLFALKNGDYKRADEITYDDLLLTYNLETGKIEAQYPLAIVSGEKHYKIYRIYAENNVSIDICGTHDIYDPVAHIFRQYGDEGIKSIDNNYYVLDINGNYCKILEIAVIQKEVTAYSIVTSGTMTTYAENIMIGMTHLNFGPIGKENKFTEKFENDKLLRYNYDKFTKEVYNGGNENLIVGLALNFAHFYNGESYGLPNLLAPYLRRKPLPEKDGKTLYTIGLLDETFTEKSYVENEIIVLPEIKSEGKKQWYVVGEYKYLQPGDSYRIKISTVIRAV